MAVPFHWYGQGLLKLVTGQIDLDTDAFKVMLTTADYVPNQDTDDFRSDVTNEIVGAGYTAGGQVLTGLAVTYDAASNQVRLAWAKPVWEDSTLTGVRNAIIYKSRGGAPAADELLAYVRSDVDISTVEGPFTVDLSTPALFITAS